MELISLFSLLEDLCDSIPQSFYDKLEEKTEVRTFGKRTTLLNFGEPVKYLYYLKKGIVTGSNENRNMVWFCEPNEIILFNYFTATRSHASHNVVVEKNSIIYQISLEEINGFADMELIKKMLEKFNEAREYFLDLNADMKCMPLKSKLQLLLKNHAYFANAELILLSSFIGASVTRVSSLRKQLLARYCD